MRIKLTAKATGEGYTGAAVDCNNFGYDGYIYDNEGKGKHSWSSAIGAEHEIPLGSTIRTANRQSPTNFWADLEWARTFKSNCGRVSY